MIRQVISGVLISAIALATVVYLFGWFFLGWPGLVAWLTGSNGFLAGFADLMVFTFFGIPLVNGVGSLLAGIADSGSGDYSD